MKKRFQSDDNHNRRLSAVVKIKYFPLFTDGTGSASQDSWAKSVVVVWKCESHIGPWTFFPLTFLLFEQADFLFWTFVSWVRKKKEKKLEAAKLQRKHSATTRLLCIYSLRQRFTVTWSWKMHESNRGPIVSSRFLCIHILLSQRRGLCRGLKISSGWKRRSRHKPLGRIHSWGNWLILFFPPHWLLVSCFGRKTRVEWIISHRRQIKFWIYSQFCLISALRSCGTMVPPRAEAPHTSTLSQMNLGQGLYSFPQSLNGAGVVSGLHVCFGEGRCHE